jgi:predicted nucleic acid-binding protein
MLVDTDIVIDYFKEVSPAVEFVEAHLDEIFISAISVAELYQGVRGAKEQEALDVFLSAITILDINSAIAKCAGLYRLKFKPSHNVGLADCLIAATANVHRLSLKTLNTKHFPMLTEVEAPYCKQ